MKIQIAAIGYLRRAQRPAPLKEKLFRKLATGNQKPIFLTTGNFIFLVIAMTYKSHPRTMKIKWAKAGQCPLYKAGRQSL